MIKADGFSALVERLRQVDSGEGFREDSFGENSFGKDALGEENE